MIRLTFLSLVIICFALSASAGVCPELPEQTAISQQETEFKAVWKWFSEPYSVYDYAGSRDRAPLGVGHLKVEYTDHGYYDWPSKIILPLWHESDGEFLGWIRSGLVLPADGAEVFPLSGPGVVETDYEQSTIIITEVQGDWLKLRYKTGANGIAWAHRCYLDLGEIDLTYQSWQELITEHGDWLSFRTDVPHVLRAEPNTDSERVTMIGLDHKLTLLKIEGDWMEVEVTQPDWNCTGPDQPFIGTTHQGWVKWRDDKVGPWVWYYTRGC